MSKMKRLIDDILAPVDPRFIQREEQREPFPEGLAEAIREGEKEMDMDKYQEAKGKPLC